jgi:hypothetical protein
MKSDGDLRPKASEPVVYVPAPASPAMIGISRASAIVGLPEGRGEVRIYFQDDLHGAANLTTFAQRALVAYERLAGRASISTTRVVPRNALVAIGTYSSARQQVLLAGPASEAELLDWLGKDQLDLGDLRA